MWSRADRREGAGVPMNGTSGTESESGLGPQVRCWMEEWAAKVPAVGLLLLRSQAEQDVAGYRHTLPEIGQQPVTWPDTAQRALDMAPEWRALCAGVEAVVLTGSGSSQFAGDCLAPFLQQALRVPVRSLGTGQLLVDPRGVLPQSGRCLVVSLARSGDSPESCAAVDALLEHQPHCEHLAITCNSQGRLAMNYRGQAKFHLLVLDERTADRSLMMTSSFTNMVLAGKFLGQVADGASYRASVEALAGMGKSLLLEHTGTLAQAAKLPFRSAVFLGDGCRHGAARESALKMLESTAGRIPAFAETFLGLRHGPMCALHADTLVVAYLSSAPVARAYQLDLIEELRQKGLGLVRLIAGENLELAPHADEIHLNRRGTAEVDDSSAVVLDAMTGQLLALFRSLHEGLKPDWPSEDGRISRVVGGFRIHSLLGVTA